MDRWTARVDDVRSASELPVHPRDPSSVEGTARGIISQAQFRPPGRTLPQRVWDWISHELSRLFSSLSLGRGPNLHVGSWVVLAVVVVLLVAAVTVILRRSSAGGARKTRPSPAVMVSADDLGVAAAVWLRRAQAAEGRGDWKEGVRCRYRALIALLVAAGAVTEEIGRTAREYRVAVDSTVPGAAAPFSMATDTFEASWYGAVPTGPEQRDALASALGPVTDAAREHRRVERATRARRSGGPGPDAQPPSTGRSVASSPSAAAAVGSGRP